MNNYVIFWSVAKFFTALAMGITLFQKDYVLLSLYACLYCLFFYKWCKALKY